MPYPNINVSLTLTKFDPNHGLALNKKALTKAVLLLSAHQIRNHFLLDDMDKERILPCQ